MGHAYRVYHQQGVYFGSKVGKPDFSLIFFKTLGSEGIKMDRYFKHGAT
jgi:hypothetical protein